MNHKTQTTMTTITLQILAYLIIAILASIGGLTTARVIIPAIGQLVSHWWQTREWKPREALRSKLFAVANKL